MTNGQAKPISCRRCGAERAKTNGVRLWLKNADGVFELMPQGPYSVQFPCLKCLATIWWRCDDYEAKAKRKLERVGRFARRV